LTDSARPEGAESIIRNSSEALPGGATRKDRGGEATKRRILGAAEAEFAAKGFDGARLAAIARAADAQQALIHHYFGDKEGLYRAVLERTLATMAAEGWKILEAKAPARDHADMTGFGRAELEGLIGAFVGMLVEFYASHMRVLRIVRDEAARDGEFAKELLTTTLKPQLDDIVARFEAMRAAGIVRADVDARHLCLSTVAMACFPNMDEAFLGVVWGMDGTDHAFLEMRKREIVTMVMGRLVP
jgi:AcrR family transcriptional regulator